MKKTTPTLSEACAACLDQLSVELAPKTVITYRNGLDRFREHLARRGVKDKRPVTAVTMEHFISFPAYLTSRSYKKATRTAYLSGAVAFMDWMVIQDHIDPTHKETLRFKRAVKTLSRQREAKLPRMPTRGQVDAILAAARTITEKPVIKARNIALVEFLASTGCRVDEVRRLRVGDIDTVERRAKVTGKGRKERHVYFGPAACRSLLAYWRKRGSDNISDPAFAQHGYGWQKSEPAALTTKTIWTEVTRIVVAAGIDKGTFTPHYFRHAFATKMLSETGNLALVQDMLGHQSPASTRVYAKISGDEMREAHQMVYGK